MNKDKILPKNTNISTYFNFGDRIFEEMKLPDNRILVQIVHTWGDGEIMNYGFRYPDGILRKGINPLQVVGIFKDKPHSVKDLEEFLKGYYNDIKETCSNG